MHELAPADGFAQIEMRPEIIGAQAFEEFAQRAGACGQFRAALAVAEKEKQIIAANAPEIERINTYIKELEESVAATEREKVAAWMMAQGYATGHGDTVEDLLKELEWQIRESEREACAAICDSFQARDVGMQPAECAGAIRARGEQ